MNLSWILLHSFIHNNATIELYCLEHKLILTYSLDLDIESKT